MLQKQKTEENHFVTPIKHSNAKTSNDPYSVHSGHMFGEIPDSTGSKSSKDAILYS